MSKKSKRKAKAKKKIENQIFARNEEDVRNIANKICMYGKEMFQDGYSAEDVCDRFYADPLNKMYLKKKKQKHKTNDS